MNDAHVRAHARSIRHRAEILASRRCGCFYCLASFAADAIEAWVDAGQTARCPRCGIDSVIGDASGFPIDETFLRRMRQHWF
jgi:hypothetical protein